MSENSRPAASFDVEYNTYEKTAYQKLPPNTVTLKVENFIRVEVGGWGTLLKVIVDPGAKLRMKKNQNGTTTVYLTPPKKAKTSMMTQEQLNKEIAKLVK